MTRQPLSMGGRDIPIALEDVLEIMADAAPPAAFKLRAHEWTWTTPTGVWRLVVSDTDRDGLTLTCRRESSNVKVTVETTRRQIDGALHFMVAIGAIERHPDAPRMAKRPES